MVLSAVELAKRVLVALMRPFALTYGVAFTCKRDSTDQAVMKNFRKLAPQVHPDRGGSNEHQQQLNDARAAWDTERAKGKAAGRPQGRAREEKIREEKKRKDKTEREREREKREDTLSEQWVLGVRKSSRRKGQFQGKQFAAKGCVKFRWAIRATPHFSKNVLES